MPSAAEAVSAAVAALAGVPAEEQAEARRLLANEAGGLIAAVQSQRFADGKKEGAKAAATPTAELATARERVTELETEVETLRGKAPDYAAKEQALREKHARELAAAKQETAAERALRLGKDVDLTLQEVLSALGEKSPEDSTRLRDGWAPVARAKIADRILPNDDGTLRVLQPGSETAYDAPDAKAAARLLAADLRKLMAREHPDSIESAVQGGAGTGGGSGYAAAARSTPQQLVAAAAADPMYAT